MAKTVTGLFRTRGAAAFAVDGLMDAGFSQSDISVLMSDATRGREFAVETGTKAAEGAATGAAAGGALGAIAMGLAAIGSLAVPGLGIMAAGPLVAALAGLGAGGALGGLAGGLIGMGIPEHEAKLFAEEVQKGGILVGVQAHDDQAGLAEQVLKESGGTRIKR
jgi:hypothetical protein